MTRVLAGILTAMATNRTKQRLWAQEANRGMWNVIAFNLELNLVPKAIQHFPTQHAFTGHSIGATEVLDFNGGRLVGTDKEIIYAGCDTARSACVDDEWETARVADCIENHLRDHRVETQTDYGPVDHMLTAPTDVN
jgi:hypothetical protein